VKPYRPGDLVQGGRATQVVVSAPASSTQRIYSNPSPPNYQVKEDLGSISSTFDVLLLRT